MNYNSLIRSIAKTHSNAQTGAASAVNRHLILRNWLIGVYPVEFEQKGEDRAKYGAGLLKQMAADLSARQVPGCSRQLLDRMRRFFRLYPQLASEIRSPMSISSAPSGLKEIGSPWKDRMVPDGDNPPIGLILCTDKAETRVEYATAGLDRKLFVSRYLVALPKPKELEALIENDRAVFEQQAPYNDHTQPLSL